MQLKTQCNRNMSKVRHDLGGGKNRLTLTFGVDFFDVWFSFSPCSFPLFSTNMSRSFTCSMDVCVVT